MTGANNKGVPMLGKWTITFAVVFLVAACGGGGGGGETPNGLQPSPGAPTPSPDPSPGTEEFTATVSIAPEDNATLQGTVRLEVRGSGIGNVELLPASGYSPVYVRFNISPDGTRAWADFDTRGLANDQYTMRISAFDTPPNTPGASEIVAMAPRAWNIQNTGDGPSSQQGDPLFARQWHLKSTGQTSHSGMAATVGEDINVEPVWNSCDGGGACRGEGVNVAVVDSGVEIAHRDLQPNVSTTVNHRVYTTGQGGTNGDPTPPQSAPAEAAHGTMVAGIIASRDNNGLGGRGVAPRSSLVGYVLASDVESMSNAMSDQAESLAVSNNSWGPPDTGRLGGDSSLWQDGINRGLSEGRGGRGTIYVWANGNGGDRGDMSNYDGMANYRGVIAVGALNPQGTKASYSERGANLWISAPSAYGPYARCRNNGELAITTTDLSGVRGVNDGSTSNELADMDYSQCMGGTSAAAPVVSGVVALMLQANPLLGWRDVRAILANTARHNDPGHPRWETNAAGHRINDAYGFGAVDAAAAVNAARGWTNLPPQRRYESSVQVVNRPIPDNSSSGVSSSINISGSGISKIEWVDVIFSASDHTYSGDLEITLIAPSGTRSLLAERHLCRDPNYPYPEIPCGRGHAGWRFGVARHLDEPADGNWRLEVRDRAFRDIGTFESWQITVYGH